MADDIKIKIAADGATQAAAGVDKLVGALEKQRKTQEMIRQTSEQIKRQNVIDDLKKQAAEVNGLSTALQRWNQSLANAGSGGAAGAIGNVTNSTQKLRAQLGPATALVGNLGAQFATLVPQTGSVVLSLQRSGMAFGQILGLLGGGPGILVGGLIAGVGALATYFAEAKKEADDLAKATEANAKAMGSYLDQLQKLRSEVSAGRQQQKSEGDLRARLMKGTASAEEYGTEIDLLQKRIGNRYYSDETLKGLLQAGNRDEWDKRQQARRRLERQRDQFTGFQSAAEEQERAAQQNAFDKRTLELELAASQGDKSPGKNNNPNWGIVQEQRDKIRQFEKEQQDKSIKEEIAAERDAQKQRYDAWWEQFDAKNKAQREQWAEDDKIRAEQNEKEARDHEQLMMRLAANRKMYQDLATQSSNIIASTAIKSFQMMAKGQKAEIGAVLEGIGDQIVAMGTGYIFKGIAESILLNPQGPALIGVGTAAVGFGIGLGAAGARAPGGSAPGNGGFDTGKNPFSPRDYQQPSPLGESHGPTVININMPTVVSPTAEDGRRIQEALDAKARVYG